MNYRAPFWLPGAHTQTIYPVLKIKRQQAAYRRTHWITPDHDFIELDWLCHDNKMTRKKPLVVLFHGLEGNSQSHYAQAMMALLNRHGWKGVLPHFRSCGGQMNIAPRFYHCGDSQEIDWILRRMRQQHDGPLFAVGISLGGNALLKWLGEQGHKATEIIGAACAISAPLDLCAGGYALSQGFNRVYTRHFLRTLKQKCLLKLQQYPGLFDREAMLRASNLAEFDDIVTAPLHGFQDALDYWSRASSKADLYGIRLPTLVVNARNDPFMPAEALPKAHETSASVQLLQPDQGGHVGFVDGFFPGKMSWLPKTVFNFLSATDHFAER